MTANTATKRTRGCLNKQVVMEAAVGLFNRQGYDRTSMNEIAAALGITKAGLYHYFSSKEDIFAAGVAAASTILEAKYAAGLADDSTSDPLTNFITAYGTSLADPTFRCLVLADERILGSQAKATIRSCKRRHQRQLEQLLRDAGRPAQDARTLSMAIFGALNWIAAAFGENARRELRQLTPMLIGIARQP